MTFFVSSIEDESFSRPNQSKNDIISITFSEIEDANYLLKDVIKRLISGERENPHHRAMR